jgi:hypothetical protein
MSCSHCEISLLQNSFFEFVSNPLVQGEDGSLGHRVRPSPDEIEVVLAAHRSLPEEGKQTNFPMRVADDDAEIEAVLSALVGESSESARVELASGALSHPVLEGKPNANHVHARIRNSRTQRLHTWTSSHIAQNKYRKKYFITSRCPRHPQSH